MAKMPYRGILATFEMEMTKKNEKKTMKPDTITKMAKDGQAKVAKNLGHLRNQSFGSVKARRL